MFSAVFSAYLRLRLTDPMLRPLPARPPMAALSPRRAPEG